MTEDSEPQKRNIGRWSKEEHELFLEALLIFGKDWTKIEAHVKTRDAIHIRSHA